MKCIIVDDEPLALNDMERQLTKLGGIEICGKFGNAKAALDAIGALDPQVVFLDIDMPVMNGLEAALHFQEALPSARIVFVTAYQEYALKAFEVNALDYLLKPVLLPRLAHTLQRLESAAPAPLPRRTPKRRAPRRSSGALARCPSNTDLTPRSWLGERTKRRSCSPSCFTDADSRRARTR